jgi:hypothetical protein
MAIHIYGQTTEHEEVEIRGSVEDLTQLFITIGRALLENTQRTDTLYTADGEGYYIVVNPTDAVDSPLPYEHFLKEQKHAPKARLEEGLDFHSTWNDCSGPGPIKPEDCQWCVWVKQYLEDR